MKRNHSWFALIGFCILTGFVVAIAFAVLLTTASVALADPDGIVAQTGASTATPSAAFTNATLDTQTFTGFITDELCGARHDMGSGKSAAECAQMCVRNGAHYVLIDGEKRFTLANNSDLVAHAAGQRATVTGRLNGDQIQVAAITVP